MRVIKLVKAVMDRWPIIALHVRTNISCLMDNAIIAILAVPLVRQVNYIDN
jgi:hypothetical protein